MRRFYIFVILFFILESLATSLTVFADQNGVQSVVGITFVTSGKVPTPNQVVPKPETNLLARGQPKFLMSLPKTNSISNPILFLTGIELILTSGMLLNIKIKEKKREEDNE